jgi:hypothetical protein
MIHKLFALTFLTTPILPAQFITPEWRGSENSEHARWNEFTNPKNAGNAPDVVTDDPTADASLLCTTGSAFLTSAGNIYSFSSTLAFQIKDSADFPVANIVVQVKGLGSEIDLTSFRIVPPDATSLADVIPATRTFTFNEEEFDGDRGGNNINYAAQWDFSDAPLEGTSTLFFESTESSLSLDQVSLDTSAQYLVVPEPGEVIAPDSVPTPTLSIAGNEITLSWPNNDADFELQSSQNLTNPESWQTVTEPVTTSDDADSVTLPMTVPATFFRLQG